MDVPAMTRFRVLRRGAASFGALALAACAAPGAEQPGAQTQKQATILVDNDWNGGDRGQVVQAWVDRVTRVHPNITVDLRTIGGEANAIALFAADSQGDIHMMDNRLVLVFGGKNLLEDIGPTLAALRFDPGSLFDIADVTTWNKKRIGFMIQINSNVWVYNKSLFRERGVPEPTDKWTWEDHVSTASKLTNAEQNQWGLTGHAGVDIFPWYWQAGVDYLAPDGKTTRFDSAPSREVVSWFVDMVRRYHASPSPTENTASKPSFAAGNYATAIQSSPGKALTKAIDGRFEWEIMATPKHPRSGRPAGLVVTGVGNVVTKKASQRGHLRETVQALTELYAKDVQDLYLSLSTGSVPPLKSVFNSPASLQAPPQNLRLVGDQISTGRNYDQIPGSYPMSQAVKAELTKAQDGGQSASDAALNMKRLGDAALFSAVR
jgi:ABC-type glycerol-3-phosphate transport system substrate-binding protein